MVETEDDRGCGENLWTYWDVPIMGNGVFIKPVCISMPVEFWQHRSCWLHNVLHEIHVQSFSKRRFKIQLEMALGSSEHLIIENPPRWPKNSVQEASHCLTFKYVLHPVWTWPFSSLMKEGWIWHPSLCFWASALWQCFKHTPTAWNKSWSGLACQQVN